METCWQSEGSKANVAIVGVKVKVKVRRVEGVWSFGILKKCYV